MKQFEKGYIESCKKQFEYYKMLGEKTFEQLDAKDLFWQPDPSVNSIAIIVKHLWGNMLSRWTNFLEEDGEKVWRNREDEFVDNLASKQEFIEKWAQGWNCLFSALDAIDESNIDTVIYIRNMGHSLPEAINRQLCHYSYHVGQIVLMGKLIKKSDFKSLSIPKGQTAEYNKVQIQAGKRMEHFSDKWLKGNQ